MANGFWGGRFPLLNLISSQALCLLVNCRVIWLRSKNYFKSICVCRNLVLRNDESVKRIMAQFLEEGHDKLNIGGGAKNLKGFVNIDFVDSPNVQRKIVANIHDLSFVPSKSISHVHSNHVVEHLSFEDLKQQVFEWNRILKVDGLLSLRCPNILGVSYGFWFDPVVESHKDEFVELGFPIDEDFGSPADKWMHRDIFGLIHWFYGDIGNIQNQHLNQIVTSKLYKLLEANGFVILRIAQPEAVNIVVVARKK